MDEIDLLGVRPTPTGLEGWHVEVQASFRPVNFITKLTEEMSRSLGKKRGAAIARSDDMMRECVRAWVIHKFTRDDKVAARERAWPGIQWKFYFVHGVVKHEAEVAAIKQHDITVIPLHQVLSELGTEVGGGARGAGSGKQSNGFWSGSTVLRQPVWTMPDFRLKMRRGGQMNGPMRWVCDDWLRFDLLAARARGRLGGHKPIAVDDARVHTTKKMHADRSLSVAVVCQTLRISRPTLYRYVGMK